MIELPALEYHVAHGCNLTCQQCSHYSDWFTGGQVTVEQAQADYSLWSHRLKPKRFALLGGEPTMNPQLCQHLRLARAHWPQSSLMLVSNGFFLHRHPELPQVLLETNCRLEISQHGTAPRYLEKFHQVKKRIWQWRADYPDLQIKIRQSHQGWIQQYRMVDGNPLPFTSEPAAAYQICMQKHCTQLYQGALWKCPAIAYFPKLEHRLQLQSNPVWQPFRDYQACPSAASDAEAQAFLATAAIPQCILCPARKISLIHNDPTSTNTYAMRREMAQ